MNKTEIIEDLLDHKKCLWMHYIDLETMEAHESANEFLTMYNECSMIIEFLRENLDD